MWERDQILGLLDSIARGFPIGSILLWQSRQELRSEQRIADLEIDLPRPDYPVNYLLDGQQRLSSICGALFWKPGDAKSRWNIVYDLRDQSFAHLDNLDDAPLHQIRVNKLSDPTAFFRHVASLETLSSSDKVVLATRAGALFNRFKDYKLATVTLGDMSIQDVAPIFERINSTGTPLTIVDLMRAATWSPEFDLVDSIDNILEDLAEKGFQTVERKVVLRTLSTAAGGGFSVDSIDLLRTRSAERLKEATEATRESYKRMVDFVTSHIRVPNADVIPYSNQLAVLAEIFRRIPIPTAAQYQAISRWFWRSAASGYFSGWNTGQMASDLRSIGDFADGLKTEIEIDATIPGKDIWKERQFRANTAHAKLLAIILAHANPIDLLTGTKIDTVKALSWSNTKEFHHFFPRAFLKSKGVAMAQANSLANIVMLTSVSNKRISAAAPSDYLIGVIAAGKDDIDAWLESNLISKEAFNAALRDDFDTFLECRAATLHERLLSQTA